MSDKELREGLLEMLTKALHNTVGPMQTVDDILAFVRQHDKGRWMNIETAPKDGTIILVSGRNKRGYTYIADAKYIGGEWCLFDPENDSHSWPSDCHTHWMPLPPAPGDASGEG